MVCDLYGLTKEETAIVEGQTPERVPCFPVLWGGMSGHADGAAAGDNDAALFARVHGSLPHFRVRQY